MYKLRSSLERAEKLFENIKRLSQLQNDLSKLRAKDGEIENLILQLQQVQAADQIKDNYALLKAARDEDKKAQAAVISAKKYLKQAQQELEKHNQKLEQIKAHEQEIAPQIKIREEALKSAENYEQQLQQYQGELERNKKNQSTRQENLFKLEKSLKQTEIKLKDAQKQTKQAELALNQYSPGGKRLEQLQEVLPFLSNWKLIDEQTCKSRQKLETIVSEKEEYQQNYQKAVVDLEKLQSILQEKQKLLQDAENTNNLAVQNNHAAALRSILHDGDNCPVCSGIYQKNKLPALLEIELVDTTELRMQKEAAEEDYKTAEKVVDRAKNYLENSKQKELESQQELQEIENQLANLQQQINIILKSETWEIDEINKEFKLLQESDKKYHESLTKKKDLAAIVIQTEQVLEAHRNAHKTASLEYDDAIAEVKRWEKQLQEVEIKLHELTGGKTCADLKAELEKDKQKLEKQLQQANESYQAADKTLIQYETQNKEAHKLAEETASKKSKLEQNWQVALVSSEFTEESFKHALDNSKHQKTWQKQITDYSNQKLKLETQVEEVKTQVGDSTTDESTLNSLRNTKIITEQKLQERQNRLTNFKVWIEEVKSKQKQAQKLKADLFKVKEQAETYSTLAQNLQSDKFQAYILEHLETKLVNRATDVLQDLTDSRYILTSKDGEYFVEDNWNGGESRRVQTLSGGETFATSLSMALALSEKLSTDAELGSLFLDEGFGTLDGETLETVHQILESLRQQDKLIGIITHVKELGERLPQVKVRKSPEGSKLELEAF